LFITVFFRNYACNEWYFPMMRALGEELCVIDIENQAISALPIFVFTTGYRQYASEFI